MLLALTRPSRAVDLSRLDLSRRRFLPEGVTFSPAVLAKQSRQDKQLAEFFFPAFPHNTLLCPVETLRVYEDRTRTLRQSTSDGAEWLFVALIKPHGAVSSSTIARWLKCTLEAAGIDTSTFSAHSVRSAATSAAANMGVTTNDILKAADWSTESVFQKFYYKPLHDGSFGSAVLSTK